MLPVGTYYFGFLVGNDLSQSKISPLSSSFSWTPVGAAIQVANVALYQWKSTQPATPTGSSTYTWATATNSSYTTADGWSVTAPANPGTDGIKLWLAVKNITASPGTTTTTINWTSGANISAYSQNGNQGSQGPTGPTGPQGPQGATGATGASGNSARQAFARVAGNPSPVSGSITTSGGSSYPSSTESQNTWGFAASWVASDPNPISTSSLYQTDGIYNPVTNITTWTTPYISYLKVGQLSAITADMGSITAGELTIGSSPAISGGTMTGSGARVYTDGRFALGNSAGNIVFNGTNAFLNGFLTQATANSSGTTLTANSYTSILSFSVTKNVAMLISCCGYYINNCFPSNLSPSINPAGLEVYLNVYIYDSSGNQVSGSVLQLLFSGPVTYVYSYPSGNNYFISLPLTFFKPITLPVGSYTMRIGPLTPVWYDSTTRSTNGSVGGQWYGFAAAYQAIV